MEKGKTLCKKATILGKAIKDGGVKPTRNDCGGCRGRRRRRELNNRQRAKTGMVFNRHRAQFC